MDAGKILLAQHQGQYVIELSGDVRLTLCATIEACLQKMFADPGFVSVTFDVRRAQCLDSTTLGLMAKISFMAQKINAKVPSIISDQPDITRLLTIMGFSGPVFIILGQVPENLRQVEQMTGQELATCNCNEQEAKARMIEAHKILMSINRDNHEQFKDLVQALENTPNSENNP